MKNGMGLDSPPYRSFYLCHYIQVVRKAVNDLDALTVKQEKFCLEYAKSGNARQAYINAGYKHKKDSTVDVNACRLLKNDKIKSRLAELAEEAKNNSIADIQEMQEILTSIVRQQKDEEIIVCDPLQGAVRLTKKASLKDIINAINSLGKMQGAFVDKIEAGIDLSPIVIKDDVVE